MSSWRSIGGARFRTPAAALAVTGLILAGCRELWPIEVIERAQGEGGGGDACLASYDNGLIHEGRVSTGGGGAGGTTTTTTTTSTGGSGLDPELVPCSSLKTPVLVYGSDSVPPILQQIGPKLAADVASPITVVYAEARSCVAMDAIYEDVPLSGLGCFYAIDGKGDDSECGDIGAKACALDGALPIDIAVSDVFPATCNRGSDPAIEYRPGPIQASVFITAARSSREAISFEAARATYAPHSTEIASPWDDDALVLQRIVASGTQRLMATVMGLDPDVLMRGTSFSSSTKLVEEVEEIDASGDAASADRVLGIYDVSNADRRTKDGQVRFKVLAYQRKGEACAFKPDASGYDKANVRNGNYDVWSPLHFVRRKGLPNDLAATRVLDLVLMDPDVTVPGVSRAEVFATWVNRSFVPECAMEWERGSEMGEMKPHETSSCKSAFECTLQVSASAACARCDDASSKCPDGSHCDFRFGYCEDD